MKTFILIKSTSNEAKVLSGKTRGYQNFFISHVLRNRSMYKIVNMTLAKALQSLSEIENHNLKMSLIDVMAELANDQFKKGMQTAENIWRRDR